MLAYWINDLALFLYVMRIWVASADADKRSENLYIEKFSDLTEREKIAKLKPSAVHLKTVKFCKYTFIISQLVMVLIFFTVGLIEQNSESMEEVS